MSELKLYGNIMKIGLGIEVCLEQKLDVPALVLIYSGIDVVGWLASPDEDASEQTFIEWTDAYLLKARPLKCTALDLWGARCGLLHTLTPYSRRSRKGQSRLICPVYNSARMEDMQEFIDQRGDSERYVAVHVKGLYEAWRLGTLHFVEELEGDPGRKARVYAKADKFFSQMSPELLNQALAGLQKKNRVSVESELEKGKPMPKPTNDQELLAYSDEHVAYEVERFFWLAALLSDPQTRLSAVSADDVLRLNHALIEAFALHLRNLLEFLYDHKNQDHIVAEQFCEPGVWKEVRPPKPQVLGRAWGRANEEIAHLTEKRKPREQTRTPWPFKGIADEIGPLIERLAANAVEGRLSSKVRQAIEAKPEPTSLDKRAGIGPSSSSAAHGMPVVGITGTSRFLSEDPGPPKERK